MFFHRAKAWPDLCAEAAMHPVGLGVDGRHGGDPCGRALQHGDVAGGLRHFRHEGHGRRTGADDGDGLARVVEIVRPVLRVDDLARKRLLALEVRAVALVVIVVAGTDRQEVAGQVALALRCFDREVPKRIFRRPAGRHDLVVVENAFIDAELAGRIAHVFEDGRPVGDGLLAGPRAKCVAERRHVGIRTHAGIAEEIPRAADRIARLQNGIGFPRQTTRDMVGRANAGQAGTYDEDVDMVRFGHWMFPTDVALIPTRYCAGA